MGELGRLLRETREEKGLTLEEVEQHTRIRAKFLAALEGGNYDQLPTPGHVHGFLRNYTVYLGLDWGEVQALYDDETSSHRLFEPGIFHPKDIALAPRKPLIRASLVLGLVIALVVLVIGGWAFWQYGWSFVQPMLPLRSPWAALPTPVATPRVTALATSTPGAQSRLPTATRVPSSTPTRQQSVTATRTLAPTQRVTPTETPVPPTVTTTATRERPAILSTPTSRPTQTPAPTSTRDEGVVLEIKVIERSWLQVTVDEQELPGELLEADQERRWEAQSTIYYICGNAGGVEVAVNGRDLGTLGERGEVVERTWTVDGEVTPTPRAVRPQATQTPTATPASASP